MLVLCKRHVTLYENNKLLEIKYNVETDSVKFILIKLKN